MFKKPPNPPSLEETKSESIDSDTADEGNDPVSKTCRICLGDGETPIFGSPSFSKDIIKFGGIRMTENDGLPQHICTLCLELLKSAVQFNIIAMESDHYLQYDLGKDKDDFSDTISFTNDEDSEQFSDNKSMDQSQSSDISCVYLDYDSSENEPEKDEDEEKEVNAKDNMYMVIVSNSDKSKDIRFHCELCNLMFETPDEINEHLLTHKPETCRKCEICSNIMEKNIYEIHMKLHREAFKQKIAKNKAQCKKCGKVVTKTYLKYHMKIHGTVQEKMERMKRCNICDKVFSYYYFNHHMKRIHGEPQDNTDTGQERTKLCPLCDRAYKESHFSKHMASHGVNRKQYICDQCGRHFKHHSVFHTHTLTHGADLKYKCQFCPYRGLHLGLLKIHVRTHTKDYLYQCSTCSKKFLTKSNLSVHERRHKAPAFKCLECNRGFYSKRNLDKHYNMIHLGIRDQKCDVCGKTFGHRDGLLAHQKQVHKRKLFSYKGRLPSYLRAEHNVQITAKKEEQV